MLENGTLTTGGTVPIVNIDFTHDLLIAGTTLVTESPPPDGGMAIYSRKHSDFSVITECWVDNRWDIQRRRAPDATAKFSYP